jgi:hypothetical protein
MSVDRVLNSYHEAGHALCFVHYGIADQFARITIGTHYRATILWRNLRVLKAPKRAEAALSP